MNQQTPTTLIDPDTAYSVVHQRVYAPVFFEKLAADYGIRPQSQEDAYEMLTMAAQIRIAHDTQQKQAAVQQNPLAAAKAHLNNQLTKMGFDMRGANQAPQRIKQAAVQASFDPEVAHAILSMQAIAAGVTPAQLAAQAAAVV